MKRTIIFGDIHGCYEEWQALMGKLKVTSRDRLICVGDLISKGPSSSKTLDLAMSLENLTCVMGNQELRFIRSWDKGEIPSKKPYDRATYDDLKRNYQKYMRFISHWPFYVNSVQFLVVHAGLRPGIPLHRQSQEDLTELRTIPKDKENRPWYDFYQSKKIAVFGHWPRRSSLLLKNVAGIDTGCVYGGKLSAFVFPEKKVVSVSAKRIYFEHKTMSFT